MKQFAVVSDVHANLDALVAVLENIRQKKVEDIFFLGDAVGYGPNPNECVDMLGKNCRILIAGNHDWGALGITDITYFNEYARDAIAWTRHVMTEEVRRILDSFPLKEESHDRDIFFVHSTPKSPDEWHYLFTLWDAEVNFNYFQNKFCFIGHSHQPFIIEMDKKGELVTYRETATIREGCRYIINAGSVGQPRDGDPRACYTIVEDSKIEMVRVDYDIEAVQNKMMKERLPYPLIERLSLGR